MNTLITLVLVLLLVLVTFGPVSGSARRWDSTWGLKPPDSQEIVLPNCWHGDRVIRTRPFPSSPLTHPPLSTSDCRLVPASVWANVPRVKCHGIVSLVGAGPGDPGLLTRRGAERLAQADVVVHDALVNGDLLRLAPATAEIIFAGKRPQQHALTQEELNQRLIELARAGKRVVRLKGGDPYVFGRGGEEAAVLSEAGIPFEVVPGVSSAIAVAAYAGIPVTHRDHASSFQVVTGHEDPTRGKRGVDWSALARTPGTTVILMGMERLPELTQELIAHGLAGETPAATVRWGTTGRQVTVEGTLANIAERVAAQGLTAPAVTVIGDVVQLRPALNWFEKRSLFGHRIVVTRTREQASDLAHLLLERGADVLEVPTIRLEAPSHPEPLVEAITGIGEYDWLVFTSANGVARFFEYFFIAYPDIRDLGGVRIAAVGPSTAARLKELHLKVDVIPEQALASKVAHAIHAYENVENLRILLARAEVANPDLPKQLEELGAIVDDIACYRTVAETEDRNGAATRLKDEGADWVTFTSSSTVEHFHTRFDLPTWCQRFPQCRLASIGPETSKALAALGLKAHLEARPHTLEGLVRALETAVK